jgi:adenine-specific DNA-methyltransferase
MNRPARIDYTRHADSRVNIPTQELGGFVAKEEQAPYDLLYPRDPSLDPQLVWKGKDEQDREDLAVPTVPIYIQEKIHPQAIIEDLRRHSPFPANGVSDSGKAGTRSRAEGLGELSLFSDFNGIEDFEQKVDFYHHEGHWTNRMILGDSLLVMNSLAEKEKLKGKVQMIYLDPPYGIKFGSNWQVSTRRRQVTDRAEDASRQPEQVRAFRDTWQLGIHSYLGYLRDRLVVARELLTGSGSLFIQIGDENVHLVRAVLEEVFGADQCVSQISFRKTGGEGSSFIGSVHDYILWFAKDKIQTKYRQLFRAKQPGDEGAAEYTNLELPNGTVRKMTPEELSSPSSIPDGARVFATWPIVSPGYSEVNSKPIEVSCGSRTLTLTCPANRHWSVGVEGTKRLWERGRLLPREGVRIFKRYMSDFSQTPLSNQWIDTRGEVQASYVVQTSAVIIQRCLLMATDPGDLVLDPTCGSGTTAYVAEQWGRRWITVDTSRVALALARTRLMAGRYPYYLLADSQEGAKKEAELTGKLPPRYATENDVRKGFVYRRVPHVTLKSIANNPDIHEGMSREEIDAAILRHAETEMLYDQPYEDSKHIRVAGPFTVESLAPHRVLATNPDAPRSEEEARTEGEGRRFEAMILENLKKAGVQNTRRNERLKLETLEPYAGLYLHACGAYTDSSGEGKTVAVSIGPEFGTVGADWVKEAAKEAVRGVGFDLLVVCGFSFDGYASEEARQFGALTVLAVRMNNDLSMGDELLKKTGAGNLFMAFAEPDVEIATGSEGVVVEVKGLDVYDPTTGQIRSGSTDDIAVWFIDTDYNGESFFVRHAYFLGAGDPYDKLKRALRAQIDEEAWASLYRAKSRPFPEPATGKIAVKVINHYGDEVLKVYDV